MSKNLTKVKPVNVSQELVDLRIQVSKIQKDVADVSSNLLEKTKLKEVENIEETISNAVSLLRKISHKDESKWGGVFKSLARKIPFSKKVEEKIEQSINENMSMKESVDKMHDSIDRALETMTSDLEDLTQIYMHIEASLEEGQEKKALIESFLNKAQEDNRRIDSLHAKKLLTQLNAINHSNQESLNGLNMQLQSAQATTDILAQILPILKPTLYQQASIAVANINNERVRKTFEITTGVLNEVMISNKKSSQETIKETLKLSNEKIIKKETIQEFDKLNDVFKKDLTQLAGQMRKDSQEYEETLKRISEKTLAQGNVLLQLEAGESEEEDSIH